MLKISNVKVKVGDVNYQKKISQLLNVPYKQVKNVSLIKQALDARRKNAIHYICSFTFDIENETDIILKNKKLGLSLYNPFVYEKGTPSNKKIVVVGSGPAGLFLSYQLVRSNQSVILLERGQDVDTRAKDVEDFFKNGILNLESNIQFGEGGAGTFSDGKLTASSKDIRKQFVLETLVEFGAPEDILYKNKPHVGTDVLRNVVKNIRNYIIENGGTVLFGALVNDISIENNFVKKVGYLKNNKQHTIDADNLVIACGHSARDVYKLLDKVGVNLEQKPFAVGLRIEHLQSFINTAQYGDAIDHSILPVADYKMAVNSCQKRGVYSFCMCPGGEVVNASSHYKKVVVNGMSNYNRDNINANSAILVTVDQRDFGSDSIFAGVEFQEKLEKKAFELGGSNYSVPIQRIEDFLSIENNVKSSIESSIQSDVNYCDLEELFPVELNNCIKEGLFMMDKKIPGFIQNAILSGVESRSSAPIRIIRNEKMECNISGIFPIGEGAGYAGGIMSSAIDGLKLADILLQGE